VNNHLGAILAYAELIALVPGCSPEVSVMAKGISAAVRQSSAPLDTLAALVSEDLVTVETINLNEGLSCVSELFRFDLGRAGFGLDVSLPATVCAFPGVRTRVYRAIAHVIRYTADTMESTRELRRVRIRLVRTPDGFAAEVFGHSSTSELPAALDEARAHIAYHGGKLTSPTPGALRIEIPLETRLIKAAAAGPQ